MHQLTRKIKILKKAIKYLKRMRHISSTYNIDILHENLASNYTYLVDNRFDIIV